MSSLSFADQKNAGPYAGKQVETYGAQEVHLDSNGREIYVISDLHLASGLNPNSNFEGTENFYADDSFGRFMDHLQNRLGSRKAIFIINGDFIDFLRIKNIPARGDLSTWHAILKNVGINKAEDELQKSIVKKEREYGLKTDDYKSVWKLHVCIRGHKKVFEQLAMWLMRGNQLIIVKGNHDLEWYWKAVRDYLSYWLSDFIAQKGNGSQGLSALVSKNLLFVDNALLIDKMMYIEHGHRYQNTTEVKGEPVLKNSSELNLPFGSFFNRYLVNRLELTYPYLDNIRPTQKILPFLIRERFPLAIKVLFQYLPFTVLIIPKKLYKQTFKYLLNFLFLIIIPLGVTAYAVWQSWPKQAIKNDPPFLIAQGLNVVKNFGFLFLSYVFGRIMEMLSLKDSGSLLKSAKPYLEKFQVVTFGHTHNPEQRNESNKWFFNTGTWIPVFETSSADVRMDKTYTFLEIQNNGLLHPVPLKRWNDDAGRDEFLGLNDKQ